MAGEKPAVDHHDSEPEIGVLDHEDKEHKTTGKPGPVYPMSDEDYVVTFKTWVVVTILA